MRMPTIHSAARAGLPLLILAAVACHRGKESAQSTAAAATPQPVGPAQIDVVTVVEQPLNVQLSLPAELHAYQSVDMYARVPGFVKTVTVDRGSKVRGGDLLITLDAPKVASQRAEGESKEQAAQEKGAAAQA